jgi:hypothetical protein
MDWQQLKAKKGDRVSVKWNDLIDKADSVHVTVGKFTRIRGLPGGGILVNGLDPKVKLLHPWKMSGVDESDTVGVRPGMVAGQFPWVSEELRLGDTDEEGSPVRVQLKPKAEGFSYLAVGVNVRNSQSKTAEIDPDGKDTWNQLRLSVIDTLPRGFGSGGVLEDGDGWAWYPLVKIEWEEKRVSNQFQIVMHNLGHLVVAGDNNEARHFFPPL